MNQNQQQYLQSAVQVLKEHGMEVNVKNISHFVNGAIPENIIQEWIEAEQGMQALDQALDPDGLSKEGQEAWGEYEKSKEGFFIGQHVYERDTFAPGVITAIDEDGIADVRFTNGSTDGISLEDLTTEAV